MSENKSLQNDLQKSSSSTPKKGRKPKMEKMEVEKKFDDIAITSANIEQPVVDLQAGQPDIDERMDWIRDTVAQTKTCSACSSVMRQWAYREPFKYCPKCGTMAKIAQ